jgi:hypothetical protein
MQKILFYKFGYEKKYRIELKTIQVRNIHFFDKINCTHLLKLKNTILIAPLITNDHILSNKKILVYKILSYCLLLSTELMVNYINIDIIRKDKLINIILKENLRKNSYRIKNLFYSFYGRDISYLLTLYQILSKIYYNIIYSTTDYNTHYHAKHSTKYKIIGDLNLELAKIGKNLYNFHSRRY